MSLFHYMASSIPLPVGERGGTKSSLDRSGPMPPKSFHFLSSGKSAIPPDWLFNDDRQASLKDEEIAVFGSLEDAAGIYIDELTPNSEAIRQHFVHPYVYRIAPYWGGTDTDDQPLRF